MPVAVAAVTFAAHRVRLDRETALEVRVDRHVDAMRESS